MLDFIECFVIGENKYKGIQHKFTTHVQLYIIEMAFELLVNVHKNSPHQGTYKISLLHCFMKLWKKETYLLRVLAYLRAFINSNLT